MLSQSGHGLDNIYTSSLFRFHIGTIHFFLLTSSSQRSRTLGTISVDLASDTLFDSLVMTSDIFEVFYVSTAGIVSDKS